MPFCYATFQCWPYNIFFYAHEKLYWIWNILKGKSINSVDEWRRVKKCQNRTFWVNFLWQKSTKILKLIFLFENINLYLGDHFLYQHYFLPSIFKLLCPDLSTTPITAMWCRQCLPLIVVQLKGKHCRKSHCRNGVVF